MTRCYCVRRLSPFMGTIQALEIEDARAISPDGLRWQLQIRTGVPRPPGAASAPRPRRFLRYGHWSRAQGLSRFPLPPGVDVDQVNRRAAELVGCLEDAGPKPLPYPPRDRFELWLLDARDRLPLALLASVTEAARVHLPAHPAWTALPQEGLLEAGDRQPPAETRPVEALIRERAGRPAAAQWFERLEDGSGRGFEGVHLPPSLRGRRLPAAAFPPLLVAQRWREREAREAVSALVRWQAPWLLTLDTLDEATRARLEHHAAERPLAVRAVHRLYPQVVQPGLLRRTLVEAELRRTCSTTS